MAKEIIKITEREATLCVPRTISGADEPKLQKVKTVSFSEYLKKLKDDWTEEEGFSTPPLPRGTFYYARRGEREVLVLEQPPQSRTVRWQSHEYSKSKVLKLAFPYVILVCVAEDREIQSDQVDVFYRNKPLASLSDELYYSNLLNASDGHICLPWRRFHRQSLIKQTEMIWSDLWNSEFNEDQSYDFKRNFGRDKRISSMQAWEKASAEDELFALSVSWARAGTLRGYIADMLKDPYAGEDGKGSFTRLVDLFYCCSSSQDEEEQ